MNWVDFFILVVLLIAVISGFKRGLFKEISTLIGLILAIILSINYADALAMKIEGTFNISPSLLYLFCFVSIFVSVLFVLKLLGHYFYTLVKITPLRYPNKIGGSIFGLIKGTFILSLVFLMFIFFPTFQNFNQSIDKSVMAPTIRKLVPSTFDVTAQFRSDGSSFVQEVTFGVLGSKAQQYAQRPESLLEKNELLGMSFKDIRVLNNIDKYFGRATELAKKGDKD